MALSQAGHETHRRRRQLLAWLILALQHINTLGATAAEIVLFILRGALRARFDFCVPVLLRGLSRNRTVQGELMCYRN